MKKQYYNSILKGIGRYVGFINQYQKAMIFLFFFILYNLNFRNISTGDATPASLIPFALLQNHNLYLDSYIPYFGMGNQTPYFLLNTRNHFISFFPIVTPILVTPLYVIPYLALKFYGISFSMYDPHLYLFVSLIEKISASIIASLSCVFIFLSIKELFDDKIAWIATIIFGMATNTWSTSSQALWQHGMVELLLVIMIYLVLRIETEDNAKHIILLGLLSGFFIFNRPPDSVFLIPIMFYVFFLKKKSRIQYCFSLILASLPFAFYNLYMSSSLFGGYNQNVEILTIEISTLIRNTFGLLFSPNRGLFIYSPILVLSLSGVYKIDTINNKNIRMFFYSFIVSIILNILIYASFNTCWWGGVCYGPRFLSGMVPILVIYIAIFVNNIFMNYSIGRQKMVLVAILVLFVTSAFVQLVGSFYYDTDWDYSPHINDHTERLWNWNDSQILTTYKAGLAEPYFFKTFEEIPEDILNNGALVYGWEGLELAEGIPTRWMTNNGTIDLYLLQANNRFVNFTVIPFNDYNKLQVKINGDLVNEFTIDGKTNVSFKASFKQGKNQIVFYSPDGCKRPMDVPGLNSEDSRLMSFAFQKIEIENSDVIIFSFGKNYYDK